MPSWGTQDLLRAIRWYQDETGVLEYQIEDVVSWAERKKFEMPVPPTPQELLGKKLRRAARAERRLDDGMDYRGQLVGQKLVNGQWTLFWFDADGPAATQENMSSVRHLRREHMINSGVRLAADLEHWNRTHPGQIRLEVNGDLDDEIKWRLNAAREEDGQEEKAG